jgi:hypothetical protein
MRGLLRRLRGIIGTGLTWALGWAGLWSATTLIAAGLGAFEGMTAFQFTIGALYVAGCGFIAGSAFGMVLSAFERKKRLEDLSVKRIGLMGGIVGALGALALVATFGIPLWLPVTVLTVAGAGFSSGTVALAKRSDTKLIEGDEEDFLALEGD